MIRRLWTSRGQNGLFFNNRFFISPFFVIFTAVLCACITVCVCFNNNEDILDELISRYINNTQTNSFIANFVISFLTEGFFLLAFFVFGTSSVGVPLLYIIIYVYFFGKATVISFLYIEHGILCFFKSLFTLIPVYVLLCYVMTCAFIKAKDISNHLFKRDILNKDSFYILNMKKYIFSFLIYFATVSILSVFFALLSGFTNYLIS